MTFGRLSATIVNGWRRYTYTRNIDNRAYAVQIFRAWNIAAAVSTTRRNANDIFPPTWLCPNEHVACQTNGNYLDVNGTNFFHGIYFTRSGNNFQLAKDGVINPNSTQLQAGLGEGQGGWFRYSPSFCIRPDMSADIRWLSNQGGGSRTTIAQARERYIRIIPGQHCLVHNSRPVFENQPVFSWEGVTIADWNDLGNIWNHHNEAIGGFTGDAERRRTLLGHVRSNNSFLMVVVEGNNSSNTGGGGFTGMDYRTAARMMADLGCDYAINLDGGSPTQMFERRVRRYGDIFGVGSSICAF